MNKIKDLTKENEDIETRHNFVAIFHNQSCLKIQ